MSRTITVYGIANCDTVKKARAWLDGRGVDYRFHDFRKEGLTLDRVDRWLAAVGWETLVNRRGTTWRQLDAAMRDGVVDASSARTVMQQQTSIIKRPVVEWGQPITVGFDPEQWERIAGS